MAQVQPAVAPIQTRFDGGVVSPRLRGRFDSELYKKALAESINFEPLPQGSLRMRSGSAKQIALAGGNEKFAKVHASTGEDFLIELLDQKLNIYNLSSGVAVLDLISSGIILANGDFSLPNGAAWQVLNGIGVDYTDMSAGKTTFNYNGNNIGWAILVGDGSTTSGGGILYQKIVMPFPGTIHLQFDLQANLAGDHLKVKISTSDPASWADKVLNGGEAFVYDDVPPGDTAHAGSPLNEPNTNGLGTHVDLGNIHLNARTYWISFQVVSTGFAAAIDNITMPVIYDVAQPSIASPWASADLDSVKYATETGRDRTIFVANGNYPPWYLLYGGTPGNWSFGYVTFIAPSPASGDNVYPLGWGYAGSRNVLAGFTWRNVVGSLAANNFPTTIEVNDGRVYYGGEPAQQNRLLGSRSGSSDDFTIGVNPGDALDFKLATKGALRWLLAHSKLLGGTDLGYNAITGSKGYPLVGDISAPSQSGSPSASIQATIAGSTAIYASADLRRIRAVSFDFQTQGFESKDVTFAAEHITEPLIKEIHHAWTPDLTLIILFKDGTLAACSFEPREQVTAWWTASLTGGTILTAAVQQGTLGAYLWMAVQRGGNVYLEKLSLSESKQETLTYLDSWIALNSNAGGALAGLDHLNGSTVRVVQQGGGYLGDFPVVAGVAQLGVDNANKAVFAGLPYLARAKTLPRDLRHGKAQSPKLGVILNNSALPKLNGKRPPDRSPATPMGNPEPLITGKRITGNLGWDDEDAITIEQDLPFRTEVCALYSATQTEQGL
jgi:hypothetical protein